MSLSNIKAIIESVLINYYFKNKYTFHFNSFIFKYSEKNFHTLLRHELYNIKNVDDCIKILKYFETTDDMFENIIYVYNLIPPTDKELQTFSILFQKYFNDLTIKGFAATTIWLISIQWIDEYLRFKE